MRRGIAVGLATATMGVAAGMGAEGVLNHNNPSNENAGAQAVSGATPGNLPPLSASVNPFQKEAQDMCAAAEPWGFDEYAQNVGPNMLPNLGQLNPTNNHIEFSGDTRKDSKLIAQRIVQDGAAQAVIYKIIQAEQGITPDKVAQDATDEVYRTQRDKVERQIVCVSVVARVLGSPKPFDLQSTSGKFAVYQPEYDDNHNFTSVTTTLTPNTLPVSVFGIKPVQGEKNPVLATQNSLKWGMTADGRIVEVANQQGEAHVAKHGHEVKAHHDKHGAPAGTSNEHAQGGGSGQQRGTGGSSQTRPGRVGLVGTIAPGSKPEKDIGPRTGTRTEAGQGNDNTPSRGTGTATGGGRGTGVGTGGGGGGGGQGGGGGGETQTTTSTSTTTTGGGGGGGSTTTGGGGGGGSTTSTHKADAPPTTPGA